MRFKAALVHIPLILTALLSSNVTLADQTDQRLDPLFLALQSDNRSLRVEAESQIWEIWYESGDDSIDDLMNEAKDAVQMGRLQSAESFYTQIVEQAPEFSEGWNRRATIRYHRQNFEGSLADIQQTLNLEPRHFGAIWGMGMILGSQRRFTDAIVAFERLLEIDPNNTNAKVRIEQLRKELLKGAV